MRQKHLGIHPILDVFLMFSIVMILLYSFRYLMPIVDPMLADISSIFLRLIFIFLTFLGLYVFRRLGIQQAISRLGMAEIRLREILVALIATIPGWIGELVIFFIFPDSISFVQNLPVHTTFVIIGPGLFEEVFFRGYLFKNLRDFYSFRSAALVSSALFGFVHIGYLKIWLPAVAIGSMIGAFVVGYALCFFVEKSSGILWGPIIYHFLYDYPTTVFHDIKLISGTLFTVLVLSSFVKVFLLIFLIFGLLEPRSKERSVAE